MKIFDALGEARVSTEAGVLELKITELLAEVTNTRLYITKELRHLPYNSKTKLDDKIRDAVYKLEGTIT